MIKCVKLEIMQKPKNHKSAFTLIELIVTAAIIVLLAVIAIPSYSKYNRTKDLQSKAEEVKALLENAVTLSKNNEQAPVRYFITISESDIEMRKNSDNGTIDKKVTLTSGQSVTSSMKCSNCFIGSTINLSQGDYLIIPYQAYTIVNVPEKRSYCLWQTNPDLSAGGACNGILTEVDNKTITVATIKDNFSGKTATITMDMIGIPSMTGAVYMKEYLPVVVRITYD